MKIEEISLTQEKIPLKTPFITALREVKDVEFIRVKILCDNGAFAYGEAPATKAVTGETLESIKQNITQLQNLLIGHTPQEALSILHASGIGSSAKAALDMALLFLTAKMNNQNLDTYFGISDLGAIKTDITISLNAEQKMLLDAKKALREGKDILKVKLGSDIMHAVEVTKMLSRELPHAKLLIDANQAWSLKDSLYYLREVKQYTLELIEQPVVADDLEALKKITHASSVPILADEAVFTLDDVKRVVEDDYADMINIKLMKCGGVTKAIEILEYARDKNVVCMLGSMLEGPYSINAALYLAFAYRDVIRYVDLDSPLLYKELPTELDFNYEANTITFQPALR
ncbi:dipeptide epimerase [Sulfurimonas paralvinellae]|uniref:Dipeptide epimerase n=1 Tax=Sulfurimonas paralvinellae TaxID=317658 RepID=A0A7M1B618_9BACT|nr:dipeptide epimerase [Sulfurimonas paralvinellae]QOP45085.1 dipeptide epimerase [Sulfurimonas paralvinellae]